MRSLVICLFILLGLYSPAFASEGAVVEFYNTSLDNYFITADANEAAQIDSGSAGPGWIRTGNSFNSGGSTSVCRFYGSYSPGPNSHFYTVNAEECQGLKDQQIPAGDPRKLTDKSWNFESLDFVSTPPTTGVINGMCPSGTVPVYRAYNNGYARGVDSNHRITSSSTAIQEVVTRGWSNEGIVMCAPDSGGTPAVNAAAGVCAATLSQDLTLQIPQLYIGGTPYSATLKIIQAADGSYTAKTTSFEPTSRSDCSDGDAGIIVISNNTYLLHIPSLIFGTSQYWINFEHIPTPGETISLVNAATGVTGAESTFKITKYGNAVTGVTGEGSALMSLTQVAAMPARVLPATAQLTRTAAEPRVLAVGAADNFEYEIQESFPGDTVASLKLTVRQNQIYTPTAEEVALATQLGVNVYDVKMTYSEALGSFSLQYFVPNSGLSPSSAGNLAQALSDVREKPKSKALQLTMTADRSVLAEPGAQSGASVVFEGIIKEGIKQGGQALAELGYGKFGDKSLATEGAYVSGILDIASAIDIKTEHENWMKRLAAAQDCADNPEVPYGAGDKERVQATVNTARTNLKMDTAVRFLNQMGSTATGIAELVPGLNYVVAAISSHTEDALKSLSEMDVKAAENGVSCKKAYQAGNGTDDTLTFSGVICDLAKPFTLKSLRGTRASYFYCTPQDSAGRLGTYTDTYEMSGKCTANGNGDFRILNGTGNTFVVYLKGSITIKCPTGSVTSVEAYDLTLTPTIAACP